MGEWRSRACYKAAGAMEAEAAVLTQLQLQLLALVSELRLLRVSRPDNPPGLLEPSRPVP